MPPLPKVGETFRGAVEEAQLQPSLLSLNVASSGDMLLEEEIEEVSISWMVGLQLTEEWHVGMLVIAKRGCYFLTLDAIQQNPKAGLRLERDRDKKTQKNEKTK